jgi:hypothetical protein
VRFKKTVNEGEIRPVGYRAAYANFASFSFACYPIGLHLIFRLKRRIWEWSCRYSPSKFEKMQRRAFMEGKREGAEATLKMIDDALGGND